MNKGKKKRFKKQIKINKQKINLKKIKKQVKN